MKIPDANRQGKEWDKLKHPVAWDCKKVKPKSERVQQAKKDNWNKACNKRLARLISDINQKKNHTVLFVGRNFSTADLEHFRTLLLSENCKIPKQPQADFLCVWITNIGFNSWMCKKQTAVSHNSAESVMI